uniref:Retrovirus-related Pol polyprotein from transposon TNT 1-94 n=1 Tax=Nicotiana tabacum TaxID=4097 RepID=A0A1S3Z7H0_TOBAC|nr:PREDICTED: uncharacterized protein LOC107783797 [Nicotiana tabacum]
MASVDPTIASLIAHVATAKHAWEILQTTYANKSQSRIFSMRDTLGNLKRDSRSISEYMQDIKSISDDLASSGSPLSNEELVIKILSGLGSEYKGLFVAIRDRDNPISFEELYDKLLAHEMFIKNLEPKLENPIITAQFHKKSTNPHSKFRNSNPSNNRRDPIQTTSTNQRTNSFQNSNSFHPNNYSNQQRVQSQLCDKFVHIAKNHIVYLRLKPTSPTTCRMHLIPQTIGLLTLEHHTISQIIYNLYKPQHNSMALMK